MAASHPQPQPRVREGDLLGTTPDGMIGRVLGDRYRVLSRLGEGGMGTVYLCEHAVLRKRFALKVLRPELADDPELVERFRNEAIAASGIGQENVVDVVDFGAEEDGALYYVMEALDGRSVGAILRDEGPIAVARALGLLEQTCRALAAAHARGVVHRDVKPENVFVVRREEQERVKILDFGISHVPHEMSGSRLTRAGSIIGTPEYMAPEQANGEVVDHRADVYAVGVLAYEMLTGMLPIEASTAIATLVAAQSRTPEAPSRRRREVPIEVDVIVLRALAKKPDDRYGTMMEFALEVARVRAGLFGAGSTPNPQSAGSPTMRYEPAGRRSSRPAQKTLAVGEPFPEDDPRPTWPGSPRHFRFDLARTGAVVGLAAAVTAAILWILSGAGAPPAAVPGVAPGNPRDPGNKVQAAAPPGTAVPPPREPAPAPAGEAASAAPLAAPIEIDSVPDARQAEPAAPAFRPPPRTQARPASARARPTVPLESPQTPPKDPYGDGDLKPDPFK